MPSIANQDFKIYGRLGSQAGIPAKYCGELYAALAARKSFDDEEEVADGFVVISTGGGIARMLSAGVYYDIKSESWEIINPSHLNPAYYDALWSVQKAIYAFDGTATGGNLQFNLSDDGDLLETGYTGATFANEDGYLIKGTVDGDGKLASLYLGEKAEDLKDCVVVRLESLLPLVGELPLDTTKIW